MMKKIEFLYHGSPNPHLSLIEPEQKTTPKDKKDAYIYATPYMSLAAIFGLSWTDNEAELHEHDKGFTFSIKKKIKNHPVTLYMLPKEGFKKIDPESDSEWFSPHPTLALEKVYIKNPLEFAKNRGIEVLNVTKDLPQSQNPE